MLSVILGILKIIGLILLAVILVLLFLLLLLLFVPIRYRLTGHYEEKPEAEAEVSWLLKLVRATVRYRDGLSVQARLLGFKVWSMEPEPESELPEELPPESPEAETSPVDAGDAEAPASTAETGSAGPEPMSAETGGAGAEPISAETGGIGTEDAAAGPPSPQSDVAAQDDAFWEEQSGDFDEEVPEGPRPPRGTPLSWDEKLQPLVDKVYGVKDQIDWWAALVKSKQMCRLLGLVKTHLVRILKNLCPRKYGGEVRFGFDDPYTTGQICSYAAMLYPIYEDRISVTPYFDREELYADLSLKGRLHLCFAAFAAARIWFSRDFKYIYRKVKKKLNSSATEEKDG
jgi:hypothetical protein